MSAEPQRSGFVGLMNVTLEKGWLRREAEAARDEVASWSAWKRNALRDQIKEDGSRSRPGAERE